MPTIFTVRFSWVPTSCGGHRADPWVGMRPTIRWQRHVSAWLERLRDAECKKLEFDSSTGVGIALMEMMSDAPVPDEWLVSGELVEMLDGVRVLAVGQIVSAESSRPALNI